MRFVFSAFFTIYGIRVHSPNRRREGFFERDLDFSLERLKTLQDRRFENLLMGLRGNVAEGQKNCVAGVVVLGVEVPQFLVGEVGYVFRIAAAVEVIGVRRKQLVTESVPKNRGCGGHRPLHLVEYDTLKNQRLTAVIVLKLNPMPLLCKIKGIQSREKYCVQINVQQVAKILSVLRGERVGRPVRASKGVHERVQRPAQHHEKRIAHGIALTATQRRVLKDMGHSG